MAKRPKRPRDPAQLAKFIVDIATGEKTDSQPEAESDISPMRALGRAGGLKGGRARADKLDAEKRIVPRRAAFGARCQEGELMRTNKGVSAGLDLIAERRKSNPDLGKFLDLLDEIDGVVGSDSADATADVPISRPYSGEELKTTERWK